MWLPDTKTGGRAVPLALSAVRLLEGLPRDQKNPWVIASRKPGSHLTDLQHPWRRIRARAELDDVRIHDLRGRFASRAPALREGLAMDRQAPRTRTGSDDGPLRPPRWRHRQGLRPSDRRQHRRRSGSALAGHHQCIMVSSDHAPTPLGIISRSGYFRRLQTLVSSIILIGILRLTRPGNQNTLPVR